MVRASFILFFLWFLVFIFFDGRLIVLLNDGAML